MAPLTRRHLARLSEIAAEDRELFLRGHPRFRGRVIAVVLAQGAASHYVTGIVWCAPSFRDEHRAALDWLNEHTEEGIRFFGVEISAIRIGESPPAPLFRLVAQPNDWTERLHAEKAASTATLTPRAVAHQAFWRLVLDRIYQEHPTWTSARVASRDSWITLPFGASFA